MHQSYLSSLGLTAAIVAASSLIACQTSSQPPTTPDASVTAYVGAQVWDGSAFSLRTLFVRQDVFVEEPLGGAGTTIDLTSHFVVPPYTEAHHHVTGADEESSERYLREGVFYALNANSVAGPFAERGDFFDRPDTYDVRLAMGGVTEPGGHPEKLYVETLSQYVYQGWTLEDFLGDAFHYARSVEEFERVLDTLQAHGSEMVKTYLLFSEDYENRRDDPEFYGLKGLNPELYPQYVAAAHARGLPVAAHVETRHDALVAARAGVDLLVHLPAHSYSGAEAESLRLDEATVKAIKDSGAAVVATYCAAIHRYQEGRHAADKEPHYALQKENIHRLKEAGIPILTGTDGLTSLPIDEAVHLHDIGGLTKNEAVAALTSGAAYLFPKRRLSCLDTGCEADFLVLENDPTADLSALHGIVSRIKAGRELGFETDSQTAGG